MSKGSLGQNRSKVVARNTMVLYFRMALMMIINLYTSRVVLNTLGVTDFGIYNAVGGVVAMLSIITSSLSVSISRYITYELGKNEREKLKRVFCTSVNVQLMASVFILLLAEIIGIWFLNNKMNIPDDRMDAANWVMHCSILVFVVNLISVPYNSAIIAHEKMSAFAYVSILEAVLKLLIVYVLLISAFDKLKLYAVLLFLVAVLIRYIYGVYCKRHFEECIYYPIYDRSLLKEMLGFAGWSFVGSGVYVVNTQGISILINIFFGVTLNAARGIANQVESAVQQFVNNFMTALNPQITKAYALRDFDYLQKLIFRGAKMSFFLMWLFTVPICLETHTILKLWLNIVPDYTIILVRWTFINAICYQFGNTLITALYATGHIKKYQIVSTLWIILLFPLTYIAFKLGSSVLWAYYVYFAIYLVMIYIRIWVAKDLLHLKVSSYFKEVMLIAIYVGAISIAIPFLIVKVQEPSLLRLVETCFISTLSSLITIYYLGLNADEKAWISSLIKTKISNNDKNIKR